MSENDDTTATAPNNPVPWDRFVKINDKAATLQARVSELEAESKRWQERAATADALTEQVQQWQTKAEYAQTQYSEYQSAAAIGVSDPELYEAARWAYGRLPEDGRPAFGEALQAWKGDPSTAPLVLRPHLTPAPAPQAAAAPAPQQAAAAPPDPNTGATAYGDAPAALDPAKMTLDEYRVHREKYKSTSFI